MHAQQVLLVVPWLQQHHQRLVFPDGLLFNTPEEQSKCIRAWVAKRAGFEPEFEVSTPRTTESLQSPLCSKSSTRPAAGMSTTRYETIISLGFSRAIKSAPGEATYL